jgi:hypothetical protein
LAEGGAEAGDEDGATLRFVGKLEKNENEIAVFY